MNRKAFTLAEGITVAVTLGILCAVALPAYSDYKTDARRTACRGALGAMRAAVANFHARSAAEQGDAAASFPTLEQFTTCGRVLVDSVPINPFSPAGRETDVMESSGTKGTLTGAAGGWCYNPKSGEVWANTATAGVGENGF